MAIVLNLGPEQEGRLRARAARAGLSAEEFVSRSVAKDEPVTVPGHSPQVAAILASVARLRAGDLEALRIQAERNAGLSELLRQWRAEPPDVEEFEGYPEVITPMGLRQPPFDAGRG